MSNISALIYKMVADGEIIFRDGSDAIERFAQKVTSMARRSRAYRVVEKKEVTVTIDEATKKIADIVVRRSKRKISFGGIQQEVMKLKMAKHNPFITKDFIKAKILDLAAKGEIKVKGSCVYPLDADAKEGVKHSPEDAKRLIADFFLARRGKLAYLSAWRQPILKLEWAVGLGVTAKDIDEVISELVSLGYGSIVGKRFGVFHQRK